MKYLFFLFLTISTLSFAQNANSKTVEKNQKPCTIEMTINQLTSDDLNFKCAQLFKNKPFKIENFKIKFQGHPSVLVEGNILNDTAKELASTLKSGDVAYIFDIENVNSEKPKNKEYQSLMIKIID